MDAVTKYEYKDLHYLLTDTSFPLKRSESGRRKSFKLTHESKLVEFFESMYRWKVVNNNNKTLNSVYNVWFIGIHLFICNYKSKSIEQFIHEN